MSDAPSVESYVPEEEDWRKLWQGWSIDIRERRFSAALKRHAAILILEARDSTESERAAVRRHFVGVPRANLRRWQQRYAKYGFDGLVDWRDPPITPETPKEVEAAICTLRQMDRDIGVSLIVAHVAKYHSFKISETVVRRLLRANGLAPIRGRAVASVVSDEQPLALGGMKLVEAALTELGQVKAMAVAIQAQVAALPIPQDAAPPDTSDRDEIGRFLPTYNERYKKGINDDIGPGFASVEVKRLGLNPERLHLSGARLDVIEQKLMALMVSPLLGGGRWDGLRTSRGELLGEMCGFPYMPSTLDLFTRELKYVGVSSTLWEVHASIWIAQNAIWGSQRDAVVLYIDGTSKPIWTDMFSQSSKVSSTVRIMPSMETVSFHSGYGVPLFMVTHSGRAPLVKVIPTLLGQLCEVNGGAEIGRIVVIDAEANSVPFLKGLEQGNPGRGWVTRLKPSLIEGKRIFNRTNYRPYRDGDRVRIGLVDLNDPDAPGETFRIRVAEIERRSKGTITYVGASTLLEERDWKPAAIADLYFDRWPKQEASFRAVNQALGFKEVHGYGKQQADNITVVTKLDKLQQLIPQDQERIANAGRNGAAPRTSAWRTDSAPEPTGGTQRDSEAYTPFSTG